MIALGSDAIRSILPNAFTAVDGGCDFPSDCVARTIATLCWESGADTRTARVRASPMTRRSIGTNRNPATQGRGHPWIVLCRRGGSLDISRSSWSSWSSGCWSSPVVVLQVGLCRAASRRGHPFRPRRPCPPRPQPHQRHQPPSRRAGRPGPMSHLGIRGRMALTATVAGHSRCSMPKVLRPQPGVMSTS